MPRRNRNAQVILLNADALADQLAELARELPGCILPAPGIPTVRR
jgi:hypothetical protein